MFFLYQWHRIRPDKWLQESHLLVRVINQSFSTENYVKRNNFRWNTLNDDSENWIETFKIRMDYRN